MGEIKRIFITGASGTGKTTLAKYISKAYDIPFISASAKDVWPKYGFKSHKEALLKCLADTKLGFDYQWEILYKRHEALIGEESFVTDRSPVDNFAYFMLQQGYNSREANDVMFNSCLEDYKLGDLLLFVRFTDEMEVEDNGRRITDPMYQRIVDSVISNIIWREFTKAHNHTWVIEIDTWDWLKRISLVRSLQI